jgi:hypothetical protein
MVVREQDLAGRGGRAGLAVVLVVTAGIALWFVGAKLALYSSFTPAAYDDLWPRRVGFLPHMAGGIVAILAGVVQLWLGFTGRTGRLHHVLGRFYVGGVAVGAAGFLPCGDDPGWRLCLQRRAFQPGSRLGADHGDGYRGGPSPGAQAAP